jgi:hypothetical protein
MRRALHVGLRLIAVVDLDLDRDDRGLHPVDHVGERGRAGRGWRRRGEGETRGERAVVERDGAERGERDRAEQRGAQRASMGLGGRGKRHGSAPFANRCAGPLRGDMAGTLPQGA